MSPTRRAFLAGLGLVLLGVPIGKPPTPRRRLPGQYSALQRLTYAKLECLTYAHMEVVR